jgi:DNA-binding MarR family transcriptional regulator
MPGAEIRVHDGFEEEYPGSSALATEVVLNVVRAADLLQTRVEAWVRSYGLPSVTAFIVLEIVRGERGPLQPHVIAERMFITRGTLTGVLDTLERHRLVRRERPEHDRRIVLVEITKAGIALLEELLPRLHEAERQWISALRPTQQAALVRTLGVLQSRLLEMSPDQTDRR